MTAWTMTPQEQEAVSNLSAISGLEHEVALRVLRKHHGNVEKAADAILSGDTGDLDVPSTDPTNLVRVVPSDNPIDLTGEDDDDEIKRALQMSMETDNQVTFGPSTRAPDPNWAVVPSNVQTQISHEEESMRQAIEASLALPEDDDIPPLEDMLRQGGRPAALRPDSANFAYAALVLHALLHVPQVRQKVSRLRPPEEEFDSNTEVGMMMKILEVFTNLELAALAVLVLDANMLEALKTRPAVMSDPPGEVSLEFFRKVATLIDDCLKRFNHEESQEDPSLFTFTSAQIELRPGASPKPTYAQNNFVIVETGGPSPGPAPVDPHTGIPSPHPYPAPNDLLARLAKDLTRYEGGGSVHNVLAKPSEVVTFALRNLDRGGPGVSGLSTSASASTSTSISGLASTTTAMTSAVTSTTPDAFVFPKSIYMDQFLLENLNLANEKRAEEMNIQARIVELEKVRMGLSKVDGQDVSKNLKATIHYYEHIARADTPERKVVVESAKKKFRDTLEGVEGKLKEIEAQITTLQAELKSLFDCPELKNHRYDLRAVLIHTGIPGRKQMYSYVQDREGVWWKTVDHSVTEVSEDVVFNDSTGLHLNAGPYMLMYSRSLTQEQLDEPIAWYEPYVNAVQENNLKFIASLPPEMLAKANIPIPLESQQAVEENSESLRLGPGLEASGVEGPGVALQVVEKRERGDVSMADVGVGNQ